KREAQFCFVIIAVSSAAYEDSSRLYRHFQRILTDYFRQFLRQQYQIELETIVVEQPPKVEFGEYALPLSFELAKRLRKAPRKIAEEIVANIGEIPGFEKLEVAGAGYINAYLKRGEVAKALIEGKETDEGGGKAKILVEHSSINPNKAAHIGHLRNAILGDSFVRLLRTSGHPVDVQNYIDNTGVQVADVVVGFRELEKKGKAEIAQLTKSNRFDYVCWDVYARASQWYAEDKANLKKRAEVLHAIEQGNNEIAEEADLIATAVLRRHLETMERLDIEYDFLPRESEILHLHFWDLAFKQMVEKGVLYKEEQGKNAGCWVMRRPSAAGKSADEHTEEDQKVIVRSNGTVGYVGKDIAYHLWKFGKLGRDFGYQHFYEYPNKKQVWISAEYGEKNHPHFGDSAAIYNVIDTRQSEAQNTVIDALKLLGYEDAAKHYTHFSYEMVALTPRCAQELGYPLSEDEMGKAYIEVSGRRGFGVKADDLIDRLIDTAKKEVDSRHPDLPELERIDIATRIAVGALRYFMLKFTKTSVIAFDFKEALSFEGETGPYAQYAVVRATNIFRKAGMSPEQALAPSDYAQYLSGETGTEIWQLWLIASQTSTIIDQCINTTEPAYLAKHAFQLAQQFNNFYHRHHILTEADENRKKFLLATAAVVRRELVKVLKVMGIEVPPVM
ncbi:MAG TPA: arginine--tRNA ligase, partial [Terriglobales bacterium]|nr:arginine--tRNA ligase [Terriglobales bacterium]